MRGCRHVPPRESGLANRYSGRQSYFLDMAAPHPDVFVSGDAELVEDMRVFFAAYQIQAETPRAEGYFYAYLPPLIIAGVPEIIPTIFLEVLKVAFSAVLAVVLRLVVDRWWSLGKLSVTIKDHQGNLLTFGETPKQIQAQIEYELGLRQCLNCRSLVPLGNFCDVCGLALSY